MLSAPRCLRQRLARSWRTSAFSTSVRLAENSSPSGGLQPHHSAEATTKSDSSRRSSVKRAGLSNISAEVRKDDLAQAGFKDYPRMDSDPWTLSRFKRHFVDENGIDRVEKLEDTEKTVIGRVSSIRSAGKTLAFVDIAEQAQHQKLQVILSEARLSADQAEHQPATAVREFIREIRRGDVISVTGRPCRTKTNEFSISASQIPQLLSPCLHPIPDRVTSGNADIAIERHAQHLADPAMLQDLYKRSVIITEMTKYLTSHDFVAVQTPILAASAGGASARPFTTFASEFPDRQLALRIAPELWLKRLMVGGMQKIFEIGPSFRNEGLDASHNPEFTTCEFYSIDWNLDRMMFHTQNMFNAISHKVSDLHPSWIEACGDGPQPPWPTIDFVPALNAALGPELELPNLSAPEASKQILAIFGKKGIPIPATPTLPRLLDHLCAHYLEPQCESATWIVNTPECLSPLAKSFPHPDLPYQQVAARAELFIRQKEVVNCYEEENSPEEQKRKFFDQQRHSRIPAEGASVDKFDDEAMPIDHDYIRALEWGLPPIGGWGCGIDRLVMLMLGKDNIRDVLSFGNLRMVTRGAEKATKS